MGLPGLLDAFAGGTTMHGVPKAIKARSSFGRAFWSVVCLAAASIFCFQFAQLLRKYYSYPKKVSIEILPLAVPFPAISVCNMRNLDIIVLNKLNDIFKRETNNLTAQNLTDNQFINEYLKTASKYRPMVLLPDVDREMFQTVLTRTTFATNINRDIIATGGVPFKEFIVTCRFGGHPCNRTQDFKHLFDPYYYNCYTYEAPTTRVPESSLAEGLENGWSTTVLTGSGMLDRNENIRIIPGTHEYLSPMSSSEGVRVVIHPPNTEPYPHTEGFDLPPGYSVSFGVRARQTIRIGAPHGNCSPSNPFGDRGKQYRLISCQKMCLQRAIVDKCGCRDIALPGYDQYPATVFCNDDSVLPDYCRENATDECLDAVKVIYARIMCVKDTTVDTTRNTSAILDCGCHPPCNEISYDVTYSLSKWPAESFDGEEAYIDIFHAENYPARFTGPEDAEKIELYGNYFDPSNRRRAMQDFARLNVYIADSNVLKTEESEDYVQSQLLSDLGGQLGLWVGISVITIVEILELVVDLFRFLSTRHGPYSRGSTFSRDPEPKHPDDVCQKCEHCNGIRTTWFDSFVSFGMLQNAWG
ncbi:hypothetical protein CAPTEDRAFT_212912 [Capitella teleta]|uniref:Uncharacterized protein n=1 Tax=Capitella teleta TaxID=283909 RepID=R7TIS6_CAPTE|nr:hypothetical protein CAPTEDRAFT_212912 [Capitella teleta]|eukprot:ELT93367.1 hypothetical protein CAPTEDRAFT_212912 [Capitella teleta]